MKTTITLLILLSLTVAINGGIIKRIKNLSQREVKAYFDYDARYRMMPLGGAAYGPKDKIQDCLDNVYGAGNATVTKIVEVICDSSETDTCQGYTGVNHNEKAIIVAFRGSEGNLQILLEGSDALFSRKVSFVTGGKVCHYFNKAFYDMWNGGLRDDFLTLKNQYPGYEFWFTGHSLGGSLATLAAAEVIHAGYASADDVIVITMGEPRTGDHEFAKNYDKIVKYNYRVVHNNDPIPHVPWEFIEYRHHKQEVWYKNDMSEGSPFTMCPSDESDRCSNSVLGLSADDHAIYFGKHMNNFGKEGCPGLVVPPPPAGAS
uniref:Lipase_3 domain-containing protein n=1 Tax=Strongyloides papillosus TaxID=174720 RepID=A0A0N5C190_STREA